jgi:prophage regulatory protein
MQDRIVREPERKQKTGVSKMTWARMERKGQAPRRRQISDSAVGWLLSEFDAWIESRVAKPGARPYASPILPVHEPPIPAAQVRRHDRARICDHGTEAA